MKIVDLSFPIFFVKETYSSPPKGIYLISPGSIDPILFLLAFGNSPFGPNSLSLIV